MASIVVLVDPDPERRRRFVRSVRRALAPLDGLTLGELEAGDLAVVWAASPRAPVSIANARATPDRTAVVWGDAIPHRGPERLDGDGLLEAWDPRMGVPASFGGFHAALRYDPASGLRLGGDVLGVFPLYYSGSPDLLLAGTSPEVFRHHPGFRAALDPEGLTGILLLHAMVDGRALLRDVRRLTMGRVLAWRPGKQPLELPQYSIPIGRARAPRAFEADVEEVDAVFAAAMRRHVPSADPIGILLSGGRDSRQLAGYLHERCIPMQALTLGTRSDDEMRCAVAVTRALGCPHVTKDLEESDFVAGAMQQARWEHLGTGFSTIHVWGAIGPLRELPGRVVSGYLRSIFELAPLQPGSDGMLPDETRRGIPRAVLCRLLRREVFDGVVETVERRARQLYEAGRDPEEERAWRWYLAHGSRAHAGGVPWRLSFGSWPVLPILDLEVLESLGALPRSSLSARRAQDTILRTRFPALARLPLDRNSHDSMPLVATPMQRLREGIRRSAAPLRRRVPGAVERRYYHRVYDIDGPGWRAVRRLAEPHRERLAGLLDMDVLSTVVPPPDTPVAAAHNVRDTFGTKLLIGLMLWSADHVS